MLQAVLLLIVSPFIGSTVATLAIRLPAGEPVALARSRCRRCGTALGARDLVPLVSWLVARGRCRHCGGAIGAYYPLAELAALAIAAAAVATASGPAAVITCLLGWMLLALALTDLNALLLPDVLTLPLIPGGIAAALFLDPGWETAAAHLIGALAGYVLFAAIGWGYRRLRGREGLGQGDAKLLAAGGAWLGWEALPLLVLLAATLALLGAALAQRTLALLRLREQEVPFGAALALAIFLLWLARSFT